MDVYSVYLGLRGPRSGRRGARAAIMWLGAGPSPRRSRGRGGSARRARRPPAGASASAGAPSRTSVSPPRSSTSRPSAPSLPTSTDRKQGRYCSYELFVWLINESNSEWRIRTRLERENLRRRVLLLLWLSSWLVGGRCKYLHIYTSNLL